MFVILDTNLFVRNWKFDSFEQRTLLDFLKRTGSIITLPAIVWDEVSAQYREKLKTAALTLKNHADSMNKFFPDDSGIVIPRYDFDKELEKYQKYLEGTLLINDIGVNLVADYPQVSLETVAKRSIGRIKPFSSSGEEFRDAIIWYSVLEIAKWVGKEQVAFISNNVNEFADSSKENIHPDLAKDVEQLPRQNVRYYPSLKNFIDEHHELVKNISIDWVRDNVNYDELIDLATQGFKQSKDDIEKILVGLEDNIFTADDIISQSGWFPISRDNLMSINAYSFLDKGIRIQATFLSDYSAAALTNINQYNTNFTSWVRAEYYVVKDKLIIDPTSVDVTPEFARVIKKPILLP